MWLPFIIPCFYLYWDIYFFIYCLICFHFTGPHMHFFKYASNDNKSRFSFSENILFFSLTFEGNFCKYRNHKLIGISFSDLYRQACFTLASKVWWEISWQYQEFFVYDELFFSLWLPGFSLSWEVWLRHVLEYTHLCIHPKVFWKFLDVYYICLTSNLEFSAVLFIFCCFNSPQNSQCYVGLHVSDPESCILCSVPSTSFSDTFLLLYTQLHVCRWLFHLLDV